MAELLTGEESEGAFTMGVGQFGQRTAHFEQEHQPVAIGAAFGDQPGQVEFGEFEAEPQFLPSFSLGARVGRFAEVHVYFASAGAPATQVRLLSPEHKQHLILRIKTVKEG